MVPQFCVLVFVHGLASQTSSSETAASRIDCFLLQENLAIIFDITSTVESFYSFALPLAVSKVIHLTFVHVTAAVKRS